MSNLDRKNVTGYRLGRIEDLLYAYKPIGMSDDCHAVYKISKLNNMKQGLLSNRRIKNKDVLLHAVDEALKLLIDSRLTK